MYCIPFLESLTMDQSNSAQDAVRCTLCQSPENLVFCEVCHTRLVCKNCHEKYPYASENHTAVVHKQYLANCTDRSLMDEPQFDSLSASSLTTGEQDNSVSPQGAESSPQDRSMMVVPRVITAFDTGFRYLYNVTCLNETKLWMRGDDSIMKLHNVWGNGWSPPKPSQGTIHGT